MAGKLRYARAINEAAHAVIARKLGLMVIQVSARSDESNAVTASAAHAVVSLDAMARVEAYRSLRAF